MAAHLRLINLFRQFSFFDPLHMFEPPKHPLFVARLLKKHKITRSHFINEFDSSKTKRLMADPSALSEDQDVMGANIATEGTCPSGVDEDQCLSFNRNLL